ncbi:MAG: hypothetical protein HUJ26_01825 [Planctomycetaceae bacterium]|nr:hypothetical protein [Planctomycetaceae bacterium]
MKILALLSLVSISGLLAGCQSLNDTREAGHQSINSMFFMAPSASHKEQKARNELNREHEEMMLESRKDMSKSNETDRWWFENVMSDEARSIERSLGVQYE